MRARAAALHTPFALELRSALARGGAWKTPWSTLAAGSAGRAVPVARHRTGLLLHLLELSPDARFPDYEGRLRVADALAGGSEGRALVVSDAAGVRRLWCWRSARDPFLLPYLEADHPPTEEELRVLAERVAADLRPVDAPGDRSHGIEALIRPLLPGPPAGASSLAFLERASTPGESRRACRHLLDLQVIDPDCGDGDRLLEAASVLEALHLAALSRLEGWSRDARSPAPRGTGGGIRLDAPDARERVRRVVLLHNLFGVCHDARALRTARLRVAAWVCAPAPGPRPGERVPGVICRVVASAAAASQTLDVPAEEPPTAAAYRAASGELRRAWAIVRDLETAGGAEPPALRLAYGELAARRAGLLRRRPRPDAAGVPTGAARHRWRDDPVLHARRSTTLVLPPRPGAPS